MSKYITNEHVKVAKRGGDYEVSVRCQDDWPVIGLYNDRATAVLVAEAIGEAVDFAVRTEREAWQAEKEDEGSLTGATASGDVP